MKPKVAIKLAGILAVMAVSASAVASPVDLESKAFVSSAKEGFVLANGKHGAVAEGLQGPDGADAMHNLFYADVGKEAVFGVRQIPLGKFGIGTDEVGGRNRVAAAPGVGDYVESWLLANSTTVVQERPMVHLPIPAVGWLFGSALIGFVSLSNRRKV